MKSQKPKIMQENIDEVIDNALNLHKNAKKYFKRKDIDFFKKFNNIGKIDLIFIKKYFIFYESFLQINAHKNSENDNLSSLENEKSKRIKKDFYIFINTFLRHSMFKNNIFSSMEMFKIFLISKRILPRFMLKNLILKKIKAQNFEKIKYSKKHKNILDLRLNQALNDEMFNINFSFIKTALQNEELDSVIINLHHLISCIDLLNESDFRKQAHDILEKILTINTQKLIILDINKYHNITLEIIKNIILNNGNISRIGIVINGAYIQSLQFLQDITKLNDALENKIVLYLKASDAQIESKTPIFSSKSNINANFICALNILKDSKNEIFIESANVFLISLAQNLNATFCINQTMNLALFKAMQKNTLNLCALQFYSNDLMQYFQKIIFDLENTFEMIQPYYDKKNMQKLQNDFLLSFNTNMQKLKNENIQNELDLKNTHATLIHAIKTHSNAITKEMLENARMTNENISLLKEQYYKNIAIEMAKCFEYYAYMQDVLFSEVSDLNISPIGEVLLDLKDINILELTSIIAANIISKNILVLKNVPNAKLLYDIFKDFNAIKIYDENKAEIAKQDCKEKYDLILCDKNHGKIHNIAYISEFCDIYLALKEIILNDIDEIYFTKKHDFIMQILDNKILHEIKNLNEIKIDNISSISIFSFDKSEIDFFVNQNISVNVNHAKRFELNRGANRIKCNNNFAQIGTHNYLFWLSKFNPKNASFKHTKSSKAISAFSQFLSCDEIDFLQSIVPNYNKTTKANLLKDSIIIHTHPISNIYHANKNSDLFYVALHCLIAFIINTPTLISFEEGFFNNKAYSLQDIIEKFKEQDITNIDFKTQTNDEFLRSMQDFKLIKIDENIALDIHANLAINKKIVFNKTIDFDIFLDKSYISFNENVEIFDKLES